MNMRITDASIEKSVEPLVEVMALMNEIKSAWDAIPRDEVDKAMTLQLERG
jgi:flagellin-specific chaperone FliS